MGTVAHVLADALARHGGSIIVGEPVASVIVEGDTARGVVLEDGSEIRARAVLVNADPFRMQALVGEHRLPAEYNARLSAMKRPGSTFKLNLALERAPSFRCLPRSARNRTDHSPTPRRTLGSGRTRARFRAVQNGKLADFPSIECVHALHRRPLAERLAGAHQLRLLRAMGTVRAFGELVGGGSGRYARRLLEIADQFAPGTSELVVDWQILHPQKIEQYFGISHGHIHHIDNGFGFAIACHTARRLRGCIRRAPAHTPQAR